LVAQAVEALDHGDFIEVRTLLKALAALVNLVLLFAGFPFLR
jgi:hypothetical protein